MAGLFIATSSYYLNQWAPVINWALKNQTSVKFEQNTKLQAENGTHSVKTSFEKW